MQTINWVALGVVFVVSAVAVLSLRDELRSQLKSSNDSSTAPPQTLDDLASDIAQRHSDNPHYNRFN